MAKGQIRAAKEKKKPKADKDKPKCVVIIQFACKFRKQWLNCGAIHPSNPLDNKNPATCQ